MRTPDSKEKNQDKEPQTILDKLFKLTKDLNNNELHNFLETLKRVQEIELLGTLENKVIKNVEESFKKRWFSIIILSLVANIGIISGVFIFVQSIIKDQVAEIVEDDIKEEVEHQLSTTRVELNKLLFTIEKSKEVIENAKSSTERLNEFKNTAESFDREIGTLQAKLDSLFSQYQLLYMPEGQQYLISLASAATHLADQNFEEAKNDTKGLVEKIREINKQFRDFIDVSKYTIEFYIIDDNDNPPNNLENDIKDLLKDYFFTYSMIGEEEIGKYLGTTGIDEDGSRKAIDLLKDDDVMLITSYTDDDLTSDTIKKSLKKDDYFSKLTTLTIKQKEAPNLINIFVKNLKN